MTTQVPNNMMADGAVSTAKLADAAVTQAKLGTNVAGNGPLFSATQTTGTQSLSANTWTKLQFAVENYDTANCYDNTTNYRFTPNVAGYYQINVAVEFNSSTLSGAGVFKNGSIYKAAYASNPNVGASATVSCVVYCNGTTDYIEVWGYSNAAGTVLYGSAANGYEFSGFLARAA